MVTFTFISQVIDVCTRFYIFPYKVIQLDLWWQTLSLKCTVMYTCTKINFICLYVKVCNVCMYMNQLYLQRQWISCDCIIDVWILTVLRI